MTGDPHRLPDDVVPRRYDLELDPDLGRSTFDGTVAITVEVVRPTDTIVLNGLELTVSVCWVDLDGRRIEGAAATDDHAERITVSVREELPVGPATLHLTFAGVLNDKLVGFYRSTFTDDEGTEHAIATTQMEATHARQAFPCWDEPAAKAVFAVTLAVDVGLTALSNAREVSSEPAGSGKRRVRFADTMVMSTYLVAFVVGPLEVTEPIDVNGVRLRIAHPPGKGHLTAYAAEVGAFSLDHLSRYYDIPYPGDKLDLVAIPDFAFGAMENLGCVTFRETLLLVDPATATREELERVVDVVAHEIAHMWFGDLVTMRWWNGIWLNEAFATFVEMKTTDAFEPAWDRWRSFGVSRAAAFDTDALSSTRPIEFEVVSPEEAEAMFDVLTYEKGASVVRMLEQFVGEEAFRSGIERYLRSHLYGNTETTDLWDAIEATTGQPVRELMDSWIFQGGFPVIDVAVSGDDVVLAQRRFAYGRAEPREWLVPAIVTIGRGTAMTVDKVIVGADGARIHGEGAIDFVMANAGASGFYRTRYSPDQAAALRDLALTVLDASERFVVVDDTWAFVVAGETQAAEFVELARSLTGERDLSVWRAVLAGLDRLIQDLGPRAAPLRVLAAEVIGSVSDELGEDSQHGDSDTRRELRARIFEFDGLTLENPDAVERARRLVEGSYAGEATDPSLAAAAERISGRFADVDLAAAMFRRHEEAPTPQEQLRALYALADTADAEVQSLLLAYILHDRKVRTQSEPFVLAKMLANRDHAWVTWKAISENWEALLERLATSTVPRMLEGIREIADASLAADVESFLSEHPLPDARRTAQNVERMQVSVAQAARTRAELPGHLERRSG